MESVSYPRVTAPYLNNYVGRQVMIVAQVAQLRGDTAVLNADGHITVKLNRVSWPSQRRTAQGCMRLLHHPTPF